jgi:tRNA(Ile)-lysidine synthase
LLKLTVSVVDVLKSALVDHCQGFFVSDDTSSNVHNKISAAKAESFNQAKAKAKGLSDITEICVAFSGGLDSTVLLDAADQICKQNNIALSAIHVNHSISTNANAWQRHCEKQCEQRGIALYSQTVVIKKLPQKSMEAEARDARYRIFDQHAQAQTQLSQARGTQHKQNGDNKANSSVKRLILLAHHQDDQAETFLLQLKRGAGLQGLSAMATLHTRSCGAQYLRPFLGIARAQLTDYAKQQNLQWIEDESNQDERYDRNFLRQQILPLLVERWPSINTTICRSAFNCAQAEAVNNEYMALLSSSLIDKQKAISLPIFDQHSDATQKSFLRYWLSTYFALSPTSAQLTSVHALTQTSNTARATNSSGFILFAKQAVERYQDKLQVVELFASNVSTPTALKDEDLLTHADNSKTAPYNTPPIMIDWHNGSLVHLNECLSLSIIASSKDPNNVNETLASQDVFTLPKTGVHCVFAGSNLSFKSHPKRPRKKLKAMYQEWGISPLQRLNTPVFVKNNEVLAVGLSPVKTTCNGIDDPLEVIIVKRL